MSTFWAWFTAALSLPLVVFAVAEGYAIATHRMTYSNWIRRKLGVAPKVKQLWWAPILFAFVLVDFDVWFIPHILSIW